MMPMTTKVMDTIFSAVALSLKKYMPINAVATVPTPDHTAYVMLRSSVLVAKVLHEKAKP